MLRKAAERKVTEDVKYIYDTFGWTMVGDVTFDAKSSEDLRECAAIYVSRCRMRVQRHLPTRGKRLLDMGCGPIQYPEYLAYSEGFDKRVCVDLSWRALESAKAKLGDRGEYLVGNILELDIEPVDAAISLHAVYHIHMSEQEAAVRKLIDSTVPGGTIVIVYSNPAYFVSAVLSPIRRLVRVFRADRPAQNSPAGIYFYRHPLSWWKRFSDVTTVATYPWRTFSTREQMALFPNGKWGAHMFSKLYALEERFPRIFTLIGCYPVIVMKKHV